MLVLSRQDGDSIVFRIPASSTPQTIRVKVGQIKPHSVRLALDARPEVNIVREELLCKETTPSSTSSGLATVRP